MTLFIVLLRHTLGIPTPSEMFGDRIAPTYNANEFLALLQRFGGYNRAKQFGVLSVLAGQLAVGIIVGVAYAIIASSGRVRSLSGYPESRRRRLAIIFITVFVAAFWTGSVIFLWPVLNSNFAGLPPSTALLATATTLAASYIIYAVLLIWLHGVVTRPSHRASSFSGTAAPRRRTFLILAFGAAAAAGLGYVMRRLYRIATFSYDGKQYIGSDVQPLTPNERFYTVTKNIVDPEVNRSYWRLEVGGLVDRPRVYTFEELSALSGATQQTTLMCISNWVGGGLMSNAAWEGIPLRDLIEASGPKEGVLEVMFRAADGYSDTIAIEKALDPSTLVAFKMNGEPLPRDHGYPARIIAPGLFGEKSVKWVTRIELVNHDAKGFYEQQGWGPNFNVPTHSRFDVPYYDQAIKLTWPISLKGIAFGGDRGVSKVEVSVDGGTEWREARIDYPGTQLTWALWSYDWSPLETGEYRLIVRATDGEGELQSAVERPTVPEGATGYHQVTLRLE